MNYLKGGVRVLTSYAIALLLFLFFILSFFNYRVFYSFVIFILLIILVYTDMKAYAIREKRPQYKIKTYPLKGFVLGLIGFSPFILMVLIYPLINFSNPVSNNLKRLIFNGLLGPIYFSAKLAGGSELAYLATTLIVPVLSMLGYMAGYYGFNLKAAKKKVKGTPDKK